jgi:hypothetical protein
MASATAVCFALHLNRVAESLGLMVAGLNLDIFRARRDINKLLGQFASLFVLSTLFALGAMGGANGVAAWPIQHLIVSTTMLVVGLFAVLSWDSALPDRRRALFLIAVVPIWMLLAIVFLSIFPIAPAIGHLALLALWATILAALFLYNFDKIPFTCKSVFHMAFLGRAAFMNIVIWGAVKELSAL